MEQRPVTPTQELEPPQLPPPSAGGAGSRCAVLPRVVDDWVSPAGSALNPTSPPATVTLAAPPPASSGGRMASPAICFAPQSARYGTLGICGVTRQIRRGWEQPQTEEICGAAARKVEEDMLGIERREMETTGVQGSPKKVV